MFGIGQTEMLVVGIIALLLFGNKLPSVARSFGKSLTEFKKGMTGVEDEFQSAMREADYAAIDRERDDHRGPSAPKFVPPTSPPAESA
jgi:sec-independent protein translocase protein TatA